MPAPHCAGTAADLYGCLHRCGGANITNWVVSDTLPAGLSLIHPVTLFPPQPGTTLAQTNDDLPILARGLVMTPSIALTLTVPVQVGSDFTTAFC